MRSILFASFGIALWACHGGGAGDDNNDSIDASGSGTVDAGPPLEGTPYTISWGSVSVASGDESTQCVVVQLPNTTAIQVHQIHTTTSTATHHVILYRDNDPAAVVQSTPAPCQPFTGALNPSGMIGPVMITQKQDDQLTLPDGVAYQFAANQFIRIEMHYINTTDLPLTATETTTFYAADPATITDQADLLFIGSPDINIPAGQSFTLHQFFKPGATETFLGAKIFAITGHEHKLGTGVVVKTGTSASDPAMTTVYDPMPFQWSEPATTNHNPTFGIPAGGGFDFTCTYDNTMGASAVKFGESATDEMCFFWAYYYPANGSHVCVHTNQVGNLNVCCPAAAGDQTATLVCNMISQGN